MKFLGIGIATIVIFFGAAYFLTGGSTGATAVSGDGAGSNVTTENGVQIVEITAKGGYQPRQSVAKAGLPTVVRFNTQGTFDCSSAVRIPSLGISKSLPMNGRTDIDIGSPIAQTLTGSCSMGMYRFQIEFRS